jgi:DNA-binding NarL/FixJ family response regulator
MGLIGIFFLVFGFWLSHQWRKTQAPSPTPPAHTSGESIAPNELLSPREQEVLALLNNGCTNQEIAQQLFLSTNTVKTHIASIYSKLDVNRRTQALAKARSMGLIQ